MNRYLLFSLYGPWCSWGEVAVGEIRPSELRPTRSALLGLLGAALGFRRHQEEELAELAQAVRFAVLTLSPGTIQEDYHTVQTSVPGRHQRFTTRLDQLAGPRSDLATVLSRRQYRANAFYRVAVAATAPCFSLERLQEALRRPALVLSLGRKSCPPALPLAPTVVETETLKEALERASPGDAVQREVLGRLLRDRREAPLLAWEEGFPAPGLTAERSLERRDQPTSRRPWLFATRRELAATFPLAGG